VPDHWWWCTERGCFTFETKQRGVPDHWWWCTEPSLLYVETKGSLVHFPYVSVSSSSHGTEWKLADAPAETGAEFQRSHRAFLEVGAGSQAGRKAAGSESLSTNVYHQPSDKQSPCQPQLYDHRQPPAPEVRAIPMNTKPFTRPLAAALELTLNHESTDYTFKLNFRNSDPSRSSSTRILILRACWRKKTSTLM